MLYLFRHRGDFDDEVAQGEGAAGVDVAVDVVGFTSAVDALGAIDFAADELGVAPAAFTAAAVGRSGNAVGFQRTQDGGIGRSCDGLLVACNAHGDFVFGCNILRIIGFLCMVEVWSCCAEAGARPGAPPYSPPSGPTPGPLAGGRQSVP